MDEDIVDVKGDPAKAEVAPAYRWVVIGTFAVNYGLGWGILSILGLLLPAISEELNLSPSGEGLLGSSAVWANIVMAIPLGLWASRCRAKAFTTATILLGVLFIFGQGWAPNFWVLVVARVFFGLAILGREPARAILTQQWIPLREIVIANSIFIVAIGVGESLVFGLTPFILSGFNDDWRNTMYLFGVVAIIPGILWVVLGREPSRPQSRTTEVSSEVSPLMVLLKYRSLWIAGLAIFGNFVAWTTFIVFWPTYMLETFDLSLKASGFVLAVFTIGSVIGNLSVVYFMLKSDRRKIFFIISGAGMTGSAVAMLVTDYVPLLAILAIANSLTWGFYYSIARTIPFEQPGITTRELAVAVSFLEMAMWVGSGVGPLITGLVREASGSFFSGLLITSLFYLTVTLAGLVLPRRASPYPSLAADAAKE